MKIKEKKFEELCKLIKDSQIEITPSLLQSIYDKAIDDLKNKLINYYIEKGRKEHNNPNPVIYRSEIIAVIEQIAKELKK